MVGAVYLTAESGYLVQEDAGEKLEDGGSTNNSGCDLFSGKWVYDNKSYPLYKVEECRFMSDQLACGKFGRTDMDYQYWRWQPHRCDLPRSLSIIFIFFLSMQHYVYYYNNDNIIIFHLYLTLSVTHRVFIFHI